MAVFSRLFSTFLTNLLLQRRKYRSCDACHDTNTSPWPDLPDLVVHSIATHLTTFRDLNAVGGVCRAWRSVILASLDVLAENITQHQPLALMVPRFPMSSPRPPPTSAYEILHIVRETDGKIYERHVPGIKGFRIAGQSFGHIIMVPSVYKPMEFSMIILNVYTGERVWYRDSPPRYFEFASLTTSPASPDCLLVLLSSSDIQYRPIGRGQWTVKEYWNGIIPRQPGQCMESSDVVVSAVAIKDRLYVASFTGRVVEVKIDPPNSELSDDRPSSYPREIWPEETRSILPMLGEYHGKLVMVHRCNTKGDYLFNESTRVWEGVHETSFGIFDKLLRNHIIRV